MSRSGNNRRVTAISADGEGFYMMERDLRALSNACSRTTSRQSDR
jgi:hypothetical protein